MATFFEQFCFKAGLIDKKTKGAYLLHPWF